MVVSDSPADRGEPGGTDAPVTGATSVQAPAPRPEVPPPPPPRTPGAPAASRMRHPTANPSGPNWTSEPNPTSSTTIPPGPAAPPNGAPPAEAPAPTGRTAARRQRRAARAAALAARPTFDRRPLRYRILPRSAIGISVVILAFALGASLSGVILYTN
jgi:hypothetical protein